MTFSRSSIIISDNLDETVENLKSNLPLHNTKIIQNTEDKLNSFKIMHSKLAIKEAYISTDEVKYILLVAPKFILEAQNAMLKVFEEPPKNIVFLLITKSKYAILPTIISRLPVINMKSKQKVEKIDIDFSNISQIYDFIKNNEKITQTQAKSLVYSMLENATNNKNNLGKKELEIFSKSAKLLELNSRPSIVLTTLILNLYNLK